VVSPACGGISVTGLPGTMSVGISISHRAATTRRPGSIETALISLLDCFARNLDPAMPSIGRRCL
jgi:hypothetical protein